MSSTILQGLFQRCLKNVSKTSQKRLKPLPSKSDLLQTSQKNDDIMIQRLNKDAFEAFLKKWQHLDCHFVKKCNQG